MLTKEKGIRLGLTLLALLLAVVLLLPVIPANYVLAQEISYDVGEYKGDKEQAQWTYPTQEGKTFAGWYTDTTFETPYTETTGQAYAKFVDIGLMGIKKQLNTEATLASETVRIRFVTAIDSLDYASVTFAVEVPELTKTWTLKETKAYTSILVSEKTTEPSEVFGSEAKYFVLHSLTGIPKSAYEAGFEVNVIWETLDGTLVSSTSANTFTVKELIAGNCTHVDTEPKDHVCDACGTTGIGGACADGDDADHTCDYCGGEVEGEACVDADPKDHVCDECGATGIGGVCADGDDADHTCDYCGGEVEGEACVDADYNCVCDECGAAVTYSINDYETDKEITTFTVASAADMVKLAEVSKADSLEGKTILMLNSIDMGSVDSFAGIGSTTYPFKGTFNGQYWTVSNLKMSGTKLGMFVQITAGQVQNLTISNANIASTGYCGVLAYHLVGAVKITNVHIKDSTITPTGNVNGGFAATCEKDSIRKEISYCTVDNLTIAGGKEQAGAVVGGMPRYVTIDHCMVTNSTINATKSAGLVTSSNTLDTVITNFISYGNTVNSGNTYGWLIANTYSADNSALENCVFYPTAGTKNGTANKFTLFNTYKNTNATNVYVSPNNETGSHATEAAEADWTSGAIAYQLGWSMKDGTVCFPDGCKATVKHTYHDTEGNVTAELYTDYAGNVIGEIPTAPEGYTWSETTQENGDKVFAPELLPAVAEEGTES